MTTACACRAPVPGFADDGEWGAAARLQQALLPPPEYSWGSWSAAHRYSTAGAAGGDIVDLIPADDRLYFVETPPPRDHVFRRRVLRLARKFGF